MKPPQSILVSPLRFIGDTVLTVPLLRALRQAYPAARIDLCIPQALINLFELCPYIDSVIPESKAKLGLYNQIKCHQYDLGIVLRRSFTEAAMMKLAGLKRTIGFDEQRYPKPLSYQRWGLFLDDVVPYPPLKTEIPQVKTYLSLLKPLGITQCDETLELWASPQDQETIAELLQHHCINSATSLALCHATSASREKALTIDKFIPGIQRFHQHGIPIIALGTPQDKAFYETLCEASGIPLINLCGQTTLRQSYALMTHAEILFSLDSAPIHMAAAAGVPHIIGIYGPTNEAQWRPYPYNGDFTAVYNPNLNCRPCVPKVCSHNRCRVDLSPLQVAQAVTAHLDKIAIRSSQA